MAEGALARRPIVDYLRINDDGDAELIANECRTCAARYTDRRNGCSRCGGREFRSVSLARTGVVRSATTIFRVPPGLPGPYTSIVVDLDGGGAVRTNYASEPPQPLERLLGARVRMVLASAGTDQEGTEAIAFAFGPDEESR